MKRLLKYMSRWQLSTPILAIIPIILMKYGITNFWLTAFIANLIGSLIFFKVDEFIFAKEMTRFQRLRKRIIRRNKFRSIIRK
tara:strand:- start:249 stop:497 length:249 start_codon:yes stop_codon:yes gene_type:complete